MATLQMSQKKAEATSEIAHWHHTKKFAFVIQTKLN